MNLFNPYSGLFLYAFHWPRISFFLFPGCSSDRCQLLLCVWKHYPMWTACPKNCLWKLGVFCLGSYWEKPASRHGTLTSVSYEGIWASSALPVGKWAAGWTCWMGMQLSRETLCKEPLGSSLPRTNEGKVSSTLPAAAQRAAQAQFSGEGVSPCTGEAQRVPTALLLALWPQRHIWLAPKSWKTHLSYFQIRKESCTCYYSIIKEPANKKNVCLLLLSFKKFVCLFI